MNCDCTEKISALMDGELPSSEARELERHLLNCVECQDARADFLSLRSQISHVPVSFAPVAQREALSRILGKEKVESGSRGSGWRWLFNPAVAAFASLLIVGLVIALLVYPRLKSKPAENSEIAVNGGKKNGPSASSSPTPREAGPTSAPKNGPPKKSQPPVTGDKKKTPNKKSTPIFEPQQDNIAVNLSGVEETPSGNGRVRSADAETMTAIHLQKSEMLLRSFRNVRMNQPGSAAAVDYEKKRAQQLVYQNMMLRREADAAGDTQVASLLESLEPILLDIANLPEKPRKDDVKVIKDRVERKNIVALLQVNSTALARALD